LTCINFFLSQASANFTTGINWVLDAEKREVDLIIEEKLNVFQGAQQSAQEHAEQYMQEDKA